MKKIVSDEEVKNRLKNGSKLTNNGCIEWVKAVTKSGYGLINIRSRGGLLSVHRLSYEVYVGNIPAGLYILHTCDNPKCINPNHLFLGTQLDNIKDMISKNRGGKKGEENSYSKLTNDEVLTIRWLYETGDYLQKQIGRWFNICQPHVSDIINFNTRT